MNKQRATLLGGVSAFLILCGAAVSVVIFFIQKTALDGIRDEDNEAVWKRLRESSAPVWILGILFVVPGVFGIMAALVQNRCLYILNSIFALVALIVMGLIFFFLGLALILVIITLTAVKDNCFDDAGGCRCTALNDDSKEYYSFKSCEILSTMMGLCIGLFVAVVTAWVFLLAMFVISCVYGCRSNTTTGGTVFVPAQQPMLSQEQQYQQK